jgi:hypothetical protein
MTELDSETPEQRSLAHENQVTTEITPLLPHVPTADVDENPDRPTGFRFAVVFACILFGDFFVGYDSSCVATLTPVLSDEFHAINDVGWYGIARYVVIAGSVLLDSRTDVARLVS